MEEKERQAENVTERTVPPVTGRDMWRVARPILGAFAVCLFFVVLYAVLTDKAAAFDDPVRHFLYSLQSDALTIPTVILTHMSNWIFMVGVCIVLLLIPRTRFRFGVPLSAGALATVALNHLIKSLVERPRPEVAQLVEESYHSFPSGHSTNSMFFYGMSIWLVWHYVQSPALRTVLTVALAIPMLLIGPTRVYLGVHYPTDVVAGWCIGFVAILVIAEIICRRERRTQSL